MEQIKIAKNRWNRKIYQVVEIKDEKVTLERSDGTQFTVAKADYNFNYFSLDKVN